MVNLVVLQGGIGAKADRAVRTQLAAIPTNEERLLLATGRYIGEGFDDARLDTLFLALPVSWNRGADARWSLLRVVFFVVDEVTLRQHALMQDCDHADAVRAQPVEDDMLALLVSKQAGRIWSHERPRRGSSASC
jgi:hypothetical protein